MYVIRAFVNYSFIEQMRNVDLSWKEMLRLSRRCNVPCGEETFLLSHGVIGRPRH